MMPALIVDSAIYVDGRRDRLPGRDLRGVPQPGGRRLDRTYKPTAEEFESVAQEFELHPLAVEDALDAHQRPKLERYGGTLFVVLKPARYLDDVERVEFGEIHIFLGENFVITVRHSESPDVGMVRQSLEANPALLRRGPEAILHAIMDRIVGDYGPVVDGLENDIQEIEAEVFGGNANVSRRVYELSREVIQFQRATQPLKEVLGHLLRGEAIEVDEVRRYLRDVQDHVLLVTERLAGFRALLPHTLSGPLPA